MALSGAERSRRHRALRNKHRTCERADVSAAVRDELHLAGLTREYETSSQKMREALTAALDEWAVVKKAQRVTLIARGRS